MSSAAWSALGQGPEFSVVYTFKGGADGAAPNALIQDTAGNLYGTTSEGNASPNCETGCGTVFQIIPSTGAHTVLHGFTGGKPDGFDPEAGVIRDSQGNLWGTTSAGGAALDGTVFRVNAAGAETIVWDFMGATGFSPHAGLVGDAEGNLYGTAQTVVFRIDSSGTYTVLHEFAGSPDDGDDSITGLLRDQAGNLFGTSYAGGIYGFGTIFKLSPDGTYTILHNFNKTDGYSPSSTLIEDAAGDIYGVTELGGIDVNACRSSEGCGVVFKLDAAGNYSVIYNFTGGPDGELPQGRLYLDTDTGSLYGTTFYGGSMAGPCGAYAGCGTVFKIDTSGKETVLYRFKGLTDGEFPASGVIGRQVQDGGALALYGSAGTIFKLGVAR